MKKWTPQTQVEGRRITLRMPRVKDAAEFIALTRASIDFHKGLANPPGDSGSFAEYVKRSQKASERCFLILRSEDHRIAGTINLSQIYHGGFKNAYLGYYLFDGFTGSGLMTEAVGLAVSFAFRDLRLHRLEANIQPHNSASIKLVKRCGFTKEGFSRKYLKIGGKWCDHERWAIIREDWKPGKKNE